MQCANVGSRGGRGERGIECRAAAEGDAPDEQASSQAPARRAFGAVDNQRKASKRKAAAKKEPAREVRDRVRNLLKSRSPLRANRAPKNLRRP